MPFFSATGNPPMSGEQGSRYIPAAFARDEDAQRKQLRVYMAFSGGGTRAAAFSYGFLEALHERGSVGRLLLSATDIISSVSGGSFTAASYGLWREEFFSDFRQCFLHKRVGLRLFAQLFNPVQLLRLASPRFDRIDMAAELYDRTIFRGRTFADFPRRRPFVVINATDLASGARFAFTETNFELLASDLNAYPIARAVAASSAFPFLLSPVTLHSHSDRVRAENFKDERFRALTKSEDRDGLLQEDLERFRRESVQAQWVDPEVCRFLHLVDGGLSDNIGARHLIEQLRGHAPDGEDLHEDLRQGKVTKLVFFVVDAKPASGRKVWLRRRAPGVLSVGSRTCSASMESYSDESTMTIERTLQSEQQLHIARWENEHDTRWVPPSGIKAERLAFPANTSSCPPVVSSYIVHLPLDADRQPHRRAQLLAIPTNFNLSQSHVALLIDSAKEILSTRSAWRDLLHDLAADEERQHRFEWQ